jgi:ketosteroid isomerase-like protein
VSTNVEIVQRAFGFLERGEGTNPDFSPDAVIDLTRALGPYRGVYGAQGGAGLWDEFSGQWSSRLFEIDEYLEEGDYVVTPFLQRLRGRDGIEVEARGTWVWELRGGQITRLTLYQEREEALAAAGMG